MQKNLSLISLLVFLQLSAQQPVNQPVEGYSALTKCALIPGSAYLIRMLITKDADPRKSASDNSLLYEAAGSGDPGMRNFLNVSLSK